MRIIPKWLFTTEDKRAIEEFVWLAREELNRTQMEAGDLGTDLATDYGNGSWTHTWIARGDEGGGIIGFVALHQGRKRSDRHTASLRIHIDQQHRGHGVGRDLLATALAWADKSGITRVTATPYVTPAGLARDLFFARHGFQHEGVMRGAVKINDTDLVNMTLLARVR